MNIFVTDPCPLTSARWLDDKRVVKMIVESTQMLSTAIWYNSKDGAYERFSSQLYRPSFQTHPCTRWTSRSRENFNWLVSHALEMCEIYTKVYDKEHKSLQTILLTGRLGEIIPSRGLQPFPNCTENKFNIYKKDIYTLYQEFMILKWTERDKREVSWKGRDVPPFFVEHLLSKDV